MLHGLHHITAVTANARGNLRYYTETLGLRLIKKTVNQDDVSAYHLFYADKLGTPGWDMTFFDWPHMRPDERGTDSIAGTMFRVPSRESLDYWAGRLEARGIYHGEIGTLAGREMMPFEDPEGQRLFLVNDRGAAYEGEPWNGNDVLPEHAIRGFYAVRLSVPRLQAVERLLSEVLGWDKSERHTLPGRTPETLTVFTMDGGGPGKEVWVMEQPDEPLAHLGYGGVHHVAFRTPGGEEQRAWQQRLAGAGVSSSGIIDRFYFQSLYFRISHGILFEIATDGPGFRADEALDELGQRLALPPFLEPHRERIEAGLRPLN